MIHELRKLWRDARLCLLLLIVVAANAIAFYTHCADDSAGYTMASLRECYNRVDTLSAEQEQLQKQWDDILQSPECDAQTERELSARIAKNRAALERISQVQAYPAHRQALVDDAQLKLEIGLFGDPNGFSARSLRRGAREYAALEAVVPQAVFLGGVEKLLDHHLTDGLLLVFMVVAGLVLLTHEKGAMLQTLTQPTRFGHSRLFFRRLGAAAVATSAGFVLLYGGNFLIAGLTLGFENLSVPVQSLYGYANCPYPLTVGGFLAQIFALKFLWALTCASLVVFFCACTGSAVVAASAIAVCAGVGFYLQSGSELWLRNVSLTQLAAMEKLYEGAIYLNFFGRPIRRVITAVGFLALVLGAAVCGGWIVFCKTQRTGGKKARKFSLGIRQNHTVLWLHETGKALFMWKGLLIVLAFVCLQVMTYRGYSARLGEHEYYYRTYSEVLAGEPNAQKDDYLQREQARFDALEQEYFALRQKYPDNMTFALMSQDVSSGLRAQEAFAQAQEEYQALRQGQSYLYQTGYEELFGLGAARETVLNFGKALFVLALLLSGFFASERETGVYVLQAASKRRGAVLRSKAGMAVVYALAVTLIALVPKAAVVSSAYGALALGAQANSALCLASLPDFWTVGTLLAAIFMGGFVLALAAAGAVCYISYRCPTSVVALILALVALLVPTAVVYLLC